MPNLEVALGVQDGLKGRHLLQIADWAAGELQLLLDLADKLKELQRRREPHRLLEGRTIGLVFDNPSTRTRVSFEVGIAQLGGTALFLPADQLQLARGESLRDTITVLSRYLDALAVRISSHEDVATLARHASIPVLNALTDQAHPCQALADVMTLRKRLGDLSGRRLVWIGDGNNLCASLLVAATTFGMHVVAATPPGYEPPSAAVELARTVAAGSGGSVELVRDARDAVVDADALYTDVWTSMVTSMSRRGGVRTWPTTGPMPSCFARQARRRSSCTACPHTTARRSLRRSCTGRSLRSGIRRRTGSMLRRPCSRLSFDDSGPPGALAQTVASVVVGAQP